MGNKQSQATKKPTTAEDSEHAVKEYQEQQAEPVAAQVYRHSTIQCQGVVVIFENTLYCTNASSTTIFNGFSKPKQITSAYASAFPRACVCAQHLIVPSSDYPGNTNTVLYAMNLHNHTWSILPAHGGVPYSRANSSVFGVDDCYVVIFGGFASQLSYSNDMHKYSMVTGKWQPITNTSTEKPEARCAFAYSYSSETRELWIHGGTTTGSDRLDDVWRFSFNTNSWKCVVLRNTTNRGSVLHYMSMHGSDRFFVVTSSEEFDEYDIACNKWTIHKIKFNGTSQSFASYKDKLMFCSGSGIHSVTVGEARKASLMHLKESLFAKQKRCVQTDITIVL